MSRKVQIDRITATLRGLTVGQLMWIERTAGLFSSPMTFESSPSSPFTRAVLKDFGDTLRIHHAFSVEAFSKDKFEYALEQLFEIHGVPAKLAAKGNPGHDITIAGDRASLKTQADKNIKIHKIHISKYMELGSGAWTDDPAQLEGLRDQFLANLTSHERIFILRCLTRRPSWLYELVEIPKQLFLDSSNGRFEMMMDSTQMPKPGYCRISDDLGEVYSLYFDGGTERKLRIQHLMKRACRVLASWTFAVPEVV